MPPPYERSRAQMEIGPELQQKLAQVTGFQIAVFPRPSLPGAGQGLPVQFVITSDADYRRLDQVVDELIASASKSGKFAMAQKSIEFTRPKTTVLIDRDRAGDLGVSMQDIGRNLATMLGDNYVNRFSLEGRSYKVIPQAARQFRLDEEMLNNYYLHAASGELVPLSTLVSFEDTVEPSKRTQFQQLNSVTLEGVVAPGTTLGEALDFLRAEAQSVLPRGFTYDYAGRSRQFIQQGSALLVTFFLSLLVIYLVLAAQFESWRDPLIILISVPMSIAGALIFITLGFATVNIYTQVGLITLIGLIAKNGILIVEFANQLQIREGLSKRAAVEQAASIRLRPILMTTVAMLVAMIPLLTASGPGAVSRFHIGLVIASGLGIGTLFTLFVVPATYALIARDHAAARPSPEPVEKSKAGAPPALASIEQVN
jgi:multidrug efflux pump